MSVIVLLLLANVAFAQTPTQQHLTGYQEALAWRLLNLAGAAYGNRYDECMNLSFPPNEQRYIYSSTAQECDILDSSCQGFIVNSNVTRQVIFIFRGTKTKGQLLLEGWQSYSKGADFHGMGNVNKYFRNGHEKLWQSVLEFFSHPQFATYSVLVTGHSLGGALASLTAARIVKEGIRPASAVQLYTFGQPRTGSYNYAQSFDALGIPSYRLVYAADIVPHQPSCAKDPSLPANEDGSRPCWANPSNEAYHHGIEIWYPQSMAPGSLFLECLGSPRNEDMSCSDQLTFQTENTDAYIWDHRHYFNVTVTSYGKSGCTNRTVTPPVKSKASSLLGKISHVLGGIRHWFSRKQ